MASKEDLQFLKELIEAGKVTPVIDRTYPLGETPEAIGYVGEGHARGKVIITVEQSGNNNPYRRNITQFQARVAGLRIRQE